MLYRKDESEGKSVVDHIPNISFPDTFEVWVSLESVDLFEENHSHS